MSLFNMLAVIVGFIWLWGAWTHREFQAGSIALLSGSLVFFSMGIGFMLGYEDTDLLPIWLLLLGASAISMFYHVIYEKPTDSSRVNWLRKSRE
jgi:4-hydroxybenzoate polyprenyltransferase